MTGSSLHLRHNHRHSNNCYLDYCQARRWRNLVSRHMRSFLWRRSRTMACSPSDCTGYLSASLSLFSVLFASMWGQSLISEAPINGFRCSNFGEGVEIFCCVSLVNTLYLYYKLILKHLILVDLIETKVGRGVNRFKNPIFSFISSPKIMMTIPGTWTSLTK